MSDCDAGVRVDTVRMQARAVADPPRNDLQLTSTGIGHEVRATRAFPPAQFNVRTRTVHVGYVYTWRVDTILQYRLDGVGSDN